MYLKHFRCHVVVIAVVAGGLVGCGGAVSTAQGLVTEGGIPVGLGSVKFVSEADPKAPPAVGAIKDGKYEVTADRGLTPGKYKVEIVWQKSLPPGKAAPPAKKFDPDLATPEGGTNSPENPTRTATMPAEVKAGPNTIDFPIPK